QIATAADAGEAVTAGEVHLPEPVSGDLVIVPVARLYNRERTFVPSVNALLAPRTDDPFVEINAADAARLGIVDGDRVTVQAAGTTVSARAHVNGAAPQGTVLLPRHLSEAPAPLTIAAGMVSKA
ncbi:MAG: hypothetical protein NZM00_09380, partial [Anaerolinea sp.]|nr:hypothetical protein [Anaerolinea sp.]